MSKQIKYNDRGEVVSVNGLTTGHHIGTPMQDAIGTEEENSAYGEEMSTVGNSENVKDEEQPKPSGGASSFNDLKDKPFYEEKKDFRTGEIKTDFESGNAFVPLGISPNDFELEVGTRIIVKWNGIEYPLITKTHSVTDYEVYWGNGALLMPMLEDTGEPFFFRQTLSGSSFGFYIMSTQSSATWEIIVPDYYTELKTLDEKFMPTTAKRFISLLDYGIYIEYISEHTNVGDSFVVGENIGKELWKQLCANILIISEDYVGNSGRYDIYMREGYTTLFVSLLNEQCIRIDFSGLENDGFVKGTYDLSYNEETQKVTQTFTVVKYLKIPWTKDSQNV